MATSVASGQPSTAATTASEPIVIHQYFPAYEVQAYARLAGLPHDIENSAYPSYESTGPLPALLSANAIVGGHPSRVLAALRQLGAPPADAHLNSNQRADMGACIDVVHGRLREVVLWCRTAFADDNQAYKQTIFGIGWVFAMRETTKNREFLNARGLYLGDRKWVEEVARKGYEILSEMYEKYPGVYFFGDEPTTLDAVVYGHLSEMRLTYPGSEWVQKHAFPALERFYANFKEDVFGATPASFTLVKRPRVVHGVRNIFVDRDAELDRLARTHVDTITLSTLPAPTQASIDAESAGRTQHGRVLTGMDTVDVLERRSAFEKAGTSTPTPQSTVTRSDHGFGLARAQHKSILQATQVNSPLFDFAVTIGIITIGVITLRAAISK